jgi:hypothetical protein
VNSFGLPKAMISVTSSGSIAKCYNATENSTQGNCGFTITTPVSGVYRINFGFPILSAFVSVSAQYVDAASGDNNNGGVNYRTFDTTIIEVFAFDGDSVDTFPRPFTIILY